MSYLDPAERLAGLQLDEEASKRCACRLYPAGTLVPDEGCPMHPDAVSTFSADQQAAPPGSASRGAAVAGLEELLPGGAPKRRRRRAPQCDYCRRKATKTMEGINLCDACAPDVEAELEEDRKRREAQR